MDFRLLKFSLLLLPLAVCQWNSDDLSLYDLIEEVNQNFYEFYGVAQDASTQEIKKAYRRLSLQWHPDRNKEEGATEKFRQVTGIYEVLKSTHLREKYDEVLVNGLPSWRQPVFYYRRMRKLAWYETIILLLFIGTLMHYMMMWAHYYEKYLVYKEKKNPKKWKKTKYESEEEAKLEQNEVLKEFEPQLTELLPFLLFWYSVDIVKTILLLLKQNMQKEEKKEEVEESVQRPVRKVEKQAEVVYEMAKDVKAVSTNDPEAEKKFAAESRVSVQKQSGSVWSPDELATLVKLSTEKYPAGTPNRWDQMGRVLNRTPDDVITMAGKLKQMKQEEYAKLITRQSTEVKDASVEEPIKVDEWTQEEQKLFETALQKFPKTAEDRWGQISSFVKTKTKKQCVARFKELLEMVKRKKVT